MSKAPVGQDFPNGGARQSDLLKVPTYPTGSFNYLRRAATEYVNGSHKEPETTVLKLDIAIAGAGIGGLAASIALRRDGHNVAIYENAPVLTEIGAGIQVPSNSSKILHSWGLREAMEKSSVKPNSIVWRRWENGKVIANTRLNPEFEDAFGSAYYITHRAHLHRALHAKAVELGVMINLDSRVVSYNLDEPSFVLASGKTVYADFVIAADGLHSLARKTLLGPTDEGLQASGYAAYRAKISVDDIKANPKTSWIMDTRSLNLWVGGSSHVMTYSILGDKFFNLVFTYPDKTNSGVSKEEDPVETIRAGFAAWDPVLTSMLEMVQGATKWPIQNIVIPQKWTSESKKTILLGDAAHAMVPFMALGAAMAIEDAAALASCLRQITSKDMLGHAIQIFQMVRIPRVKHVHEASTFHDFTMHLPDGPEQRARDAAMLKEVAGEHFNESPNQWSDPTMQNWIYTYDPSVHVRRLWVSEFGRT